MTPRTSTKKAASHRSNEQVAALERDEYHCMWHLIAERVIREANHAHHLFRPRALHDRREWIVSLCPQCHMGLRHTKGALTDAMLIEQVMIPYIWNGQDLTPYETIDFSGPGHDAHGRPRYPKMSDQEKHDIFEC